MDPTGLVIKVDCGCGRTTPYSVPPRFDSSNKLGQRMTKLADAIRATASKSDEVAHTRAYVLENFGSFYKSEQGALIRSWMNGRLPQMMTFGQDSKITQGLRDSEHMRRYMAEVKGLIAFQGVVEV